MKSLTAVCQSGASRLPAAAVQSNSGRIARHAHQRGESAEMKMYLSKLKDLVPFMPKNRRLSKLEIIQHVIDYICDLQTELETHPVIGGYDTASPLHFNLQNSQSAAMMDGGAAADRLSGRHEQSANGQSVAVYPAALQQHSSPAMRQPLVDRQAPNTILPVASLAGASAYQQHQPEYQLNQQHDQPMLSTLQPQTSLTLVAEKESRPAHSADC